MMVAIYGFALMYLLAGMMSYQLDILQVIVIAIGCYFFDKVIFKTMRRFLTIMFSVLVTLGIVSYILYRIEELEMVLAQLIDFASVYYLSITVDTVFISEFHQWVFIGILGIILMRLLDSYINVRRFNYVILLILTTALIVYGYLTNVMTHSNDHLAFMLMVAVMILYYFYEYYRDITNDEKSFTPLTTTVITFIVIIVIGSRLLYSWDPRPLTSPPKKTQFVLSDEVTEQVYEIDKMSYYALEDFAIQESFSFNNIEVLRVQSRNLRYLKSDTFEIYEGGAWKRYDELPYLDNDGDFVQESILFDPTDYTNYYTIENVEVIVKNINTNVLFVPNYALSDSYFEGGVSIRVDPRRGIYYADELLEGNYRYNFNAVIPSYGNPNFDELVRLSSNEQLPSGLDVYLTLPTENMLSIKALAEEITEDYDNPYDKALAIESYLKERYTYEEEPGAVPEGRDPVEYFLFNSKAGFCQQFSSAFILMARSVGIPARYATGFYVDVFEPEDYDDYMAEQGFMRDGMTSVYDSDSHTWAEAYFPEVGWIMFEATPGRVYRKDIAESIELGDFELGESERINPMVDLDMNYVYGFFGLVGILALMYGFYRLIRMRYRIKHQTPTEKMLKLHQIIRAYYQSGRTRKTDNETPREYAKRIDQYTMDVGDEGMTQLMADYEDVVYGGKELDEASLEKHFNYMMHVALSTRRRVNSFVYFRMNMNRYLNYVHLRKRVKA